MGVDDLASGRVANAHVALHAAVRQPGGWTRKVFFPSHMAPGAEVRSLHGAEAEAVLVVVARGAQSATELARGRVAHEPPSSPSRGRGEGVRAKRLPRGPIGVERSKLPRGEVLARQSLLILRLVAASALAVLDGLREVRVPIWRVALSASDALCRMETLRIPRAHRRRVAILALLDVQGGPGDGCCRIGSRGRSRHEKAAGAFERDHERQQEREQPSNRETRIRYAAPPLACWRRRPSSPSVIGESPRVMARAIASI